MGIRIGILGYGNLGRGVEKAVMANPDQELTAVFTRRDPKSLAVASGAKVCSVSDLPNMKNDIDVKKRNKQNMKKISKRKKL